MYRKERQDEILAIIRKQGYATVAALTEQFHYSTATINRDLNELEKQNLVRRSYGGVEPTVPQGIPHIFRYQKMRQSKRKISALAATLVKDGETIFIDSSTTAEYMAEFLRDRKNLTVITNNNILATELFPYGIEVICLGGQIVEAPCITGGNICFRNAAMFRVDKMFFSSATVSDDGVVAGTAYVQSIIMERAKEAYFLADKEKIGEKFTRVFCDFSALTGVISDYRFPQKTKEAFPNTRFFCTEQDT